MVRLVQRLGEEGYQAALDAVVASYGSPTESEELLDATRKYPTSKPFAKGYGW